MHNKMVEEFVKARKAGTPLVSITSFDPEATMVALQKAIPGSTDEAEENVSGRGESTVGLVQWDIIHGWRHRNKAGATAMAIALKEDDPMTTINPVQSLNLALKFPPKTLFVVLNPRYFFDKPDFNQALWNLRDDFKSEQKTCVLLGTTMALPDELRQDILMLDEPLPNDVELKEIIEELMDSNEVKKDKANVSQAVDALRGISAFTAEQATAMNLSRNGVNVDGLWERKRKLISETPGLKVYSGTEKFEDIGGCDQVKRFFSNVIKGKEAPRVIVFMDEVEKTFAGATGGAGDSSGVSQDFLGTTLSYMEDNECDGAILVGPPGAAKSAIAKAMGNEAEIPTIIFDLGGMKGSLVGKSEQQLRNALKVVSAVGGGRAYFIATCNKVAQLPPELRRRFTSGIFFFDLPTREEREKIWNIYLDKFGLGDVAVNDIEFDEGWTGAEIRNCCRMAYRQNIPLSEAAKFIVPVAHSSSDQIKQLRASASGSFLSANHEGIYKYGEHSEPASSPVPKGVKRKIAGLID